MKMNMLACADFSGLSPGNGAPATPFAVVRNGAPVVRTIAKQVCELNLGSKEMRTGVLLNLARSSFD